MERHGGFHVNMIIQREYVQVLALSGQITNRQNHLAF